MTFPARTVWALFAASLLTLVACSSPPPADEPTGEVTDRAWTIVVGEDPLQRTVAHTYALALTSRGAPVLVEPREGEVAESASELGEGDGSGHDMVLAGTLSLAAQLAAAADADADADALDASAEELTEQIESELQGGVLLEPPAAMLSHAVVMTEVTAAQHSIESSAEADDPAVAEACEELRVGVGAELVEPEEKLDELYDCQPEQISTGTEDELVQQVIAAELDAVIISDSHPGIGENALITLADSERGFPQEQQALVVREGIAEEVPDVAGEVAERLDDDAILVMRQLIDGEQGLEPRDAAEYWLVEQDLIAAPEGWG